MMTYNWDITKRVTPFSGDVRRFRLFQTEYCQAYLIMRGPTMQYTNGMCCKELRKCIKPPLLGQIEPHLNTSSDTGYYSSIEIIFKICG